MPTVTIIGAGVAGLQACRALSKWGFDVLVLEQSSSVGGVWSRNYQGYGIQVPRHLYQLAEYPWPQRAPGAADSDFCSGEDVLAYLRSYVRHFGLERHIRFGCQVTMCSNVAGGGWQVAFWDGRAQQQVVAVSDYLVVASGLYSTPRIPKVQGSNIFTGLQVHAKDFTDASIAAGKRVVIIGAGKTALDCAAEVAAGSCARTITWLFRKVHWPLPPQLAPRLSVQELLFSSLTGLLVEPYYTASTARRALSTVLGPLRGAVWRYLEGAITRQFGLQGALVPTQPLQQDLLYSGQIVDAAWVKLITLHAPKGQQHTPRAAPQGLHGSVLSRQHSASSSKGSGYSQERLAAPGGAGSRKGRSGGSTRQEAGAVSGGFLKRLTGGWWSGRRRGREGRSGDARSGRASTHSSSGGSAPARSSSAGPSSRRSSNSGTGQYPRASTSQPGDTPVTSPRRDGRGAEPFSRSSSRRSSPGGYEQQETSSPSPSPEPTTPRGGRRVKIVPKQGRVAHFTRRGLVLDDSSYLAADLVLYCTGYTKSYEYLPGSVKARLGLKTDGLHLYRNILPPQLPRLAFVGSEVSTFNNPLTSGLQAEWLASHWAGAAALPGVAAMQADIKKQQEWRARLMPAQRHRGTVLQLYMSHYHSQLVTDLGLAPPRPSLMKLKVPLTACDYSHVFRAPGAALARQKSSGPAGKVRTPSMLFDIGPVSPRSASSSALLGGSLLAGGLGPPPPLTAPLSPHRRSVAGYPSAPWLQVPDEAPAPPACNSSAADPQGAAGAEVSQPSSTRSSTRGRSRSRSSTAGAGSAAEGGAPTGDVEGGLRHALPAGLGGDGAEELDGEQAEAWVGADSVCVQVLQGVHAPGDDKSTVAQEAGPGQETHHTCVA